MERSIRRLLTPKYCLRLLASGALTASFAARSAAWSSLIRAAAFAGTTSAARGRCRSTRSECECRSGEERNEDQFHKM